LARKIITLAGLCLVAKESTQAGANWFPRRMDHFLGGGGSRSTAVQREPFTNEWI
jgi:hypothetical protein